MNESKFTIYGALCANFLIAVVKFIAAYFSGSSSMISEGVHSLVDTGNEILLLIGLKRSQLPPNKIHRFGHGKELYFWSLIVSILIFGIGGGISVYEGIIHIISPEKLRDPMWNYLVLGAAFIFEGISFTIGIKSFLKDREFDRSFFERLSESKDPGLFVIIYEDGAALLGLIIAAGGVFLTHMTKNSIYDGISSILIGLVLGVVAIMLIIESRNLLIGESADQKIVQGIAALVQDHDSVTEIGVLKTMHFGPDNILLVLKVHFEANQKYADLVEVIKKLKENIRDHFPAVNEIYIEAV